MRSSKLFLYLGFLVLGSCSKGTPANLWDAVIANKENKIFKDFNLTNCQKPNPDKLSKVISLVEEGEEWAFKNAMVLTSCLDSKDHLELSRAASVFFDKQTDKYALFLNDLKRSYLIYTHLSLDTEKGTYDQKKQHLLSRIKKLEGLKFDENDKKSALESIRLRYRLLTSNERAAKLKK